MADETIEPTPDETPATPADEASPSPESEAPTPGPVLDEPLPPVGDPPLDVLLDDEPPADPIITDPVLPDAPVDEVFGVPLELLDTAAVVALETMPDETKTALAAAVSTDYWGEYEHFQCTLCSRDFLSKAAMVSHMTTDHRVEDLGAPAGTQATYDRFGNFVAYVEV